MLDRFIHHVRENNILDVGQRYLLAISGGMDSVALAHLLHLGGCKFDLVHCNFQLRGKESDRDEAFVRDLAEEMRVPIHVKVFDAKGYAASNGLSLQMAARDLRYDWFATLHRSLPAAGVLVAHQADDQLETVLLNLLRGTGIEGVYGMANKRDFIIRPLLPFSRAEIQEFVASESLSWREDSSNRKTLYKRNFIRHKFMPVLADFDPKGPELMQYSFDRIKDAGKAFFYFFEQWREARVRQEPPYEYLDYKDLGNIPGKASLLFYWLRPKGFVYPQVEQVLQAMHAGLSGKCFFAGDWMLNMDRDRLILGKAEQAEPSFWVNVHDINFRPDARVNYDILQLKSDWQIDRSSENALLDRQLLDFPLQLRGWEEGDRFKPLGMQQFKKVSDFLIDAKVPLIKKKSVKVLCSGNAIVWVVGYRIDDRFKVTKATREVVYFKKTV
ncbi:tRNA(Ile)-lysidine synthase [Cyclobacterium lianum]|uniref:tRNA(Ile)-lysidine synthase n=1 Tax=Cyclobacterium lianum TaxID=388280 RepID=A0A1M7JNU2_9BACT|nr:tRNA lysidine(34) synthetase TilS [Cyclobacterium lianum]SHM54565.1 tRNA(Ile)-lysidine synthase [Cyclobacterium lianum]